MTANDPAEPRTRRSPPATVDIRSLRRPRQARYRGPGFRHRADGPRSSASSGWAVHTALWTGRPGSAAPSVTTSTTSARTTSWSWTIRGVWMRPVWGDLLTVTAHRRGVAGTVIDGVCRDIDRSLTLGYPIFARGNWMRTGKDRVQLEATAVPVSIGGIRVEPGDMLLGDGDGLVVVPPSRIRDVLRQPRASSGPRPASAARWNSGSALRDAREMVGYHELQHGVSQPATADLR